MAQASAEKLKGKTDERTGRQGQSESQRKGKEKWQTSCCRNQRRACKMAQALAEKLKDTGPAEKERVTSVLQSEQLARTEPPLLNEKRN